MVEISASGVSKPRSAGNNGVTTTSPVIKGSGNGGKSQARMDKCCNADKASTDISRIGEKDKPRSNERLKSVDKAPASRRPMRPSHAEAAEDANPPAVALSQDTERRRLKRPSEIPRQPVASRVDDQRDSLVGASSKHSDPATILHTLRGILDASDTPSHIRKKISHVVNRHEAMMEEHAQRVKEFERTISALQCEKSLIAARDLTIDSFDSSLDRVSEGDLRAGVEGLNNSIDEFVMNLIDVVSAKPPNPDLANVMPSNATPISGATFGLKVDDDRRELLMEAHLHDGITRTLYGRFFRGNLGVSLTTPMNTDNLEVFYANAIAGKEPWRVSQRWRSITASSISAIAKPDAWDVELDSLALTLTRHLSHGLCRERISLADLHPTILSGLKRLFHEALVLSGTVKRDVLSSKMLVVMSPSTKRMPAVDPARVEVQWPMSEGPPATCVLGTYSFGLVKHDESGLTTVLLRPKVVTDQILGHRTPSSGVPPQPSLQHRGQFERSRGNR